LSEYYKNKNGGIGPDIYLKREDLNHTGSHKMNNALAQAMIAKRIGLKSVVTATGSGQHGLATASACAKLGLECTVFMADKDMDRQSSNVRLMKLLGAKVINLNLFFFYLLNWKMLLGAKNGSNYCDHGFKLQWRMR
jgi:tryptophan synthase beta chain